MAPTSLQPTLPVLLSLIDTAPQAILSTLSTHPHLASQSDQHGYTLIHAASSYAQLDVFRALVTTYQVPVDLLDEDGETPLFVAEKLEVAKCLIEECGADWRIRNSEGKTAEERILEDEGENEVVVYLRSLRESSPSNTTTTNGTSANGNTETDEMNDVHPPPPLPEGFKINLGTMDPDDVTGSPDPELRRRIEELAAREDFQTEEGQARLRELVKEVVGGLGEEDRQGRNVRRRVD